MKYYTLKQVASSLGVTTRTLTNWKKSGKIKVTKIEGTRVVRVSEKELKRLLGEEKDV